MLEILLTSTSKELADGNQKTSILKCCSDFNYGLPSLESPHHNHLLSPEPKGHLRLPGRLEMQDWSQLPPLTNVRSFWPSPSPCSCRDTGHHHNSPRLPPVTGAPLPQAESHRTHPRYPSSLPQEEMLLTLLQVQSLSLLAQRTGLRTGPFLSFIPLPNCAAEAWEK